MIIFRYFTLMGRTLILILLSGLVYSCSKKKDEPAPPPPPPPPSAITLLNSSFTLGNKQKSILDTFVLNYNKAVTVNYILLISNTCLPDIYRTVTNNGKTVKFYNMLCASLGRDYRFQVSVRDGEGQTKIDTVSFSYYQRKLPVEGEIMYYSITSDNKYAWVTTSAPNRIVCLGIDDPNYMRSYDLGFKPRKFVLNPQNQKFYILPYPFNEPNRDKFYVMNPVNGVIEKTMILKLDTYDNPSHHFLLFDIEFGQNGYGVINTGTQEYSQSRWRIIDSRYNDTVYAHPEWVAANSGTGNYFFKEFSALHINHDRSKIYMQAINALPRAGLLNCMTGALNELIYANTNPNHYLIASKTQDKLFVASYLFQSIYAAGSWGTYSNFDNRSSEIAEFSYRATDNDVIYYRSADNGYEFVLLDYFNQTILCRTNVAPDFKNIQATRDGKYMLAVTGGELYLWNTDIFYKY
jgi:hypothetical protein